MENLLQNTHPIILAFMAGIFTWAMTAVGAAAVFLAKDINRKALDVMLGFAGGVMSAAIYWSMLAPAMKIAAARNMVPWFPAAIGFLLGGIFSKRWRRTKREIIGFGLKPLKT